MGRSRFVFRASAFLAGIFFACLSCGVLAQTQQTAFDLDGKPSNPVAQGSGRVVVLVFLRQDCPVSGRYAPAIQQISEHYQRDASFFSSIPTKMNRRRRFENIWPITDIICLRCVIQSTHW